MIFHVDHKMLGLTEALSTDSAVVGFAVHVVDQVHSLLGRTSAGITFIPRGGRATPSSLPSSLKVGRGKDRRLLVNTIQTY